MILHLLHSDNKTGHQFATYVIEHFSSPEMCSEFAIVANSDSKSREGFPCQELIHFVDPANQNAIQDLVDSLNRYSGIVLHGAFYPWCETILASVPRNVTVAWMFWGGELYDRDMLFLAPITKSLTKLHSFVKRQKSVANWHLPIESFRKIDYCLTGEKEEYEYAKKYLHADRLQLVWYTYYSIEDTVGNLLDKYSSGDNVWICNSASVENNVFDLLARFLLLRYRKHLRGRTVIMPLSYGPQWVRNALVRIGPKVFRTGFKPLLEFLPRPEYNKMMLDCSTMILPHYRPAAQGNILTALWLGMRVYLSEKSMSYAFFKRIGVSIYSFESDFVKYGCSRLSQEIVERNRQVLRVWYGKEHVRKACYDVVAALQ